MSISIGIISAAKSLDNIKKSNEFMCEHCNISYFAYSSMQELTRIYLENASKFDGFLFSGQYPYDYIIENICPISKPALYLDINDRDYYWLFAKLYANHPGLNFSRLCFDDPIDFTVFENIFDSSNMPFFNCINIEGTYSQQLSKYYDHSIKNYTALWNAGKVDLFVVHLTNLADLLKSLGIPYYLLQPSPATVRETFLNLISAIRENKLQNSLVACCLIKIAKESPLETEQIALEKALLAFNMRQNMSFALRFNKDCFEAVTTSSVALDLTSCYTTCLLTGVLYEQLDFSTYIGWGIGFDLISAQQNAQQALSQSCKDTFKYTYLVTEKVEMVGPLCGDRTISYAVKPSVRTVCIAKALGISALNLEKLISLSEKKGMQEFSSDDLIYYLNITPRSATRILKKLCDCGGAIPLRTQQLSGRGRPCKIYSIDLDAIQLNL